MAAERDQTGQMQGPERYSSNYRKTAGHCAASTYMYSFSGLHELGWIRTGL